MDTLRKKREKINIPLPRFGEFRYDEPMALHTTFRIGGPADLWVKPAAEIFPEYAAELLALTRREGIPVFVLGGGANLVVADKGIRGVVLDTGCWSGWEFGAAPGLGGGAANARLAPGEPVCEGGPVQSAAAGDGVLRVRSGTVMDALVDAAAEQGWAGPEFLAGMPGTIGGAVWMNARCGEKSISDILIGTEIIDFSGESVKRLWVPYEAGDFSYKKSPFQNMDAMILSVEFSIKTGDSHKLRRDLEALRRDREVKGHYRAPSAGSAFKNNRAFGKPTGKIIDELGLRGYAVGGAAVAPWHGNFIINNGYATAEDVRALVESLIEKVRVALGISLEPEILFVGDWGEAPEKRGGGHSV
jgi:UDP-N-acetylmuramate dehydrogenase